MNTKNQTKKPRWHSVVFFVFVCTMAGVFLVPRAMTKEFILKKIDGGYLWQEENGKPVMEFPNDMQFVLEWGNLLILKYERRPGGDRRYFYDRVTGKLLKVYSSKQYIDLLFPENKEYVVLCRRPEGDLYFIDKNSVEIGRYNAGEIVNHRVEVHNNNTIVLSKKPGQLKNAFSILDVKGVPCFEIYNAQPGDVVEESGNGTVLTLSGFNIWNRVFSMSLRCEVAKGFVTSLSKDEKYLAALVWGADEPYRNEEYARVLGISEDKITEAKQTQDGLYSLFVHLYFIEIYSLETGKLVGRVKLDGNYLKIGNTGNPAVQSIEFARDNKSVKLVANYKGVIEERSFTLEQAALFMSSINNWVQSMSTSKPSEKESLKELSTLIQKSMTFLERTKEMKKEKKHIKSILRNAKYADNAKLAELYRELKNVQNKFIVLSR